MSLLKSIATVGGFTTVSRVLGFIRDIFIAKFLGATMMADAFFVALRFPNLFRSFFAEGVLNVAFVPLFTEQWHKNGKEQALTFAKSAFSFLFYVLLALTLVMEVIMPSVMFILAPGFSAVPGKVDLTVQLSRITFPFLLCVSLVSLLAGVLNSVGKFAAAALAPTILNLAMIGALFFIAPSINSAHNYAFALAIGVLAAGILELIWMYWHLKRAGLMFGLTGPIKAIFHMSRELKTLLKKMAPGILGSGVYQINLFLDTFFVSFIGTGAISWLNYAHHLFQLPIGIIGSAIGTALLPLMSKNIKLGNIPESNNNMNRGLEVSLAMSLASMVGLILLAYPIVTILFERGAFTSDDSIHTSNALVCFALGLPAYMATKALSPFFYARGDTTTPVRIGVIGVILNAILAVTLMQFFSYVGIALATTITVWINMFQYVYRLRKQGEFSLDDKFGYRAKRIIAACALMGVAIIGSLSMLDASLPGWMDFRGHRALFLLLILVGVSAAIFGLTLVILKTFDWTELKRMLNRKGKPV